MYTNVQLICHSESIINSKQAATASQWYQKYKHNDLTATDTFFLCRNQFIGVGRFIIFEEGGQGLEYWGDGGGQRGGGGGKGGQIPSRHMTS